MWNNLFTIRNWFFTQIAAITQIISDKDITHVLVASDETGSGVASALKGCHFENTTALNYPVKKG
jgi:hypothetical protein